MERTRVRYVLDDIRLLDSELGQDFLDVLSDANPRVGRWQGSK